MSRIAVKLRAVLPRSISARGVFLVVLVCLSVGVPGAIIYQTWAAEHRQRARFEQETLLAMALATELEMNPGGEGHDEWFQKVAELGRRIVWAGIVDDEGHGVEFRRRTAMPLDDILAQVEDDRLTPVVRPLQIGSKSSQRFELITVPQPAQSVTLAMILDRGDLPRATTAPVALGCGLAILIGLIVAGAYYHHAIQRPIERLQRATSRLHTGMGTLLAADDMPAELKRVAQGLGELHRELDEWRSQATNLRHTLSARVDAGTRAEAAARRQAERAADTDALTGLGNRRRFERVLPTLLEDVNRGRELAVIVLDVDHFKQLNDRAGHGVGDELLAFLGELIQATTRRGTDELVRIGGDEFVLLLPGAGVAEATAVAQRVASLFQQRVRTLSVAPPAPSLSAGIAGMREDSAGSIENLIRLADEAMYWAKRNQRDVATARDVRVGGTRSAQPR